MSNKAINAVKKIQVGNAAAKAVLIYLADCLNESTGRCDPSHIQIAETLEINRTTVMRAINLLASKGLITLEKKDPAKGRFSGLFYTLPCCIFQHEESRAEEFNMNNARHRVEESRVEQSDTKQNIRNIKPEENQKKESIPNGIPKKADKPLPDSFNTKTKPLGISEGLEKTTKLVKNKPPSFSTFPIPRSDVLPELWQEFLLSRARMKKALTELGYSKMITELDKVPWLDVNKRLIEAIDRKRLGIVFSDDLQKGKSQSSNGAIVNTNGQIQGHSKPSNAEIFAARDYSEYEGFDPNEAFKVRGYRC